MYDMTSQFWIIYGNKTSTKAATQLQKNFNSLLAKAKWGNYGQTRERKHGKQRPKILKDEGWLWNTYSWHGGVGGRRAVSNFTLIGKKNGMMDIKRGNVNGGEKKRKRKKSHMSCMNQRGKHAQQWSLLNGKILCILATSTFTYVEDIKYFNSISEKKNYLEKIKFLSGLKVSNL